MKYDYHIVSGQSDIDGRHTKRPVVEIELSNGNRARKFLALIDSGADQIHMPAPIAEALGIEREQCSTRASMGINMERIDGFIADLTFKIQGQQGSFVAPVVFIDTDIPVLLGREGFFDDHHIKFEQSHGTFEIVKA